MMDGFANGFMGGVVGVLAVLAAARMLRGEVQGDTVAHARRPAPAPDPLALSGQQQGFLARLLRPTPPPMVSEEEREEAAREAKLRAWRMRLAQRPGSEGWRIEWDPTTQRYIAQREDPGTPSEVDIVAFPDESAVDTFVRGAN